MPLRAHLFTVSFGTTLTFSFALFDTDCTQVPSCMGQLAKIPSETRTAYTTLVRNGSTVTGQAQGSPVLRDIPLSDTVPFTVSGEQLELWFREHPELINKDVSDRVPNTQGILSSTAIGNRTGRFRTKAHGKDGQAGRDLGFIMVPWNTRRGVIQEREIVCLVRLTCAQLCLNTSWDIYGHPWKRKIIQPRRVDYTDAWTPPVQDAVVNAFSHEPSIRMAQRLAVLRCGQILHSMSALASQEIDWHNPAILARANHQARITFPAEWDPRLLHEMSAADRRDRLRRLYGVFSHMTMEAELGLPPGTTIEEAHKVGWNIVVPPIFAAPASPTVTPD